MRYFFLLLGLSFILFSCETDPENLQPKISKYKIRYMFYPPGMFQGNEPTVELEYNAQGKIWRRNGGFLSVNPATGFAGTFYPDMYDEVTYHGSEIKVTRKSSEVTFNEEPKRIFLDHEGRIFKTITHYYNGNGYAYDTMHYHYRGNKLAYTLHRNQNTITTKRFFFNPDGNLLETNTLSYDHFYNDTVFTETETFASYDRAPNPLKNLGIFNEIFLRSLSENNFGRYTRERKNQYGFIYQSNYQTWNFKYDKAGNILFHE